MKKNNDILTVLLFMVISLQTVRLIGNLSIYWKTGRVIDKMSDYFLLLMYFFPLCTAVLFSLPLELNTTRVSAIEYINELMDTQSIARDAVSTQLKCGWH